MKKLPLTKKTHPESGAHASPVWEGLLSPLDLDKIEAEVNAFYVPPLRRLVKALCDEIRDLRNNTESSQPS